MTNTGMLKDKIASSGFKLKKIAEIMGITAVSLSKKTHNVTEFKASEIERLSQILHLSLKDKNEIFFAHNVDFKSTNNKNPTPEREHTERRTNQW